MLNIKLMPQATNGNDQVANGDFSQPASAITMLQVMYLWLPFVFEILITILLSKMNVEAANEKLRREKGIE